MTLRLLNLVLVAALVALAACDDDGTDPMLPPFTLEFAGDDSFQGAHGGQTVRAAVVTASGEVVATAEDQVSATAVPSFEVVFADVLEAGTSYGLHYWIDSNFGGGAVNGCDPRSVDHQWNVAVGTVTDDVRIDESHRPTETEDVCSTFAADLEFTGDASFQGAHGGQTVTAAVVRSDDGAVVSTQETTVSASADPTFAFSFPGALLRGDAYELHYWIDSNFGGGTAGTCDPPTNDHQWSVDLGVTPDDDDTVTLADVHRPTETSSVCDTFD